MNTDPADRDSTLRKALASVIVALLLIIAILAFMWHRNPLAFNAAFAPVRNAAANSVNWTISKVADVSVGTITEPTTVLFMGTDVVYSGSRRHLVVDKVALNGNSDTMMLVFFNPRYNKISILSIPRDTEAQVGTHGIMKINAANAIGGPELAKSTVTGLLNVPIDHYVVMNIQALVQFVNELGGITVEVPKKMSYMDWTAKLKIDLEPGMHTLTGNQAMGFVRFRHDALGDIGRVQRQQIFLQAVSRKMMDPSAWTHVPSLMQIAQANIQTDMEQSDMMKMLNFAHSVPRSNITCVMLPGQFAGNGDWIGNTDGRAIAARFADPSEQSVDSRRSISICVVNATSDRNFGTKLTQELRKLGYATSVDKDDKDVPFKKTRIICQNGNTADATMLQHDLGDVGDVVNASVGNLLTSITLIAHDDLDLEKITMSSEDAPYLGRPAYAQPLVTPVGGVLVGDGHKKHRNKTAEADAGVQDPQDTVIDQNSVPEVDVPGQPVPDVTSPPTNTEKSGEASGSQRVPESENSTPAQPATEPPSGAPIPGSTSPAREVPPPATPPAHAPLPGGEKTDPDGTM
jgi:LCP family protein required for cell wall assembly